MSFTFAVTAFQESSTRRRCGERIRACLRAAQDHPDINEITVVDDCSEDYDALVQILAPFSKVVLHRNDRRLKCFGNKIEAIVRSTSEWVITCDSDNVMSREYLDLVISRAKRPTSWYCPTFARPLFNYRSVVGTWNGRNIKDAAAQSCFCCFINTGNQTVRRDEFTTVFSPYRGRSLSSFMPDIIGLGHGYPDGVWDGNDSRTFNLIWLRAGGQLDAVAGMEYEHTANDSEQGNYVICAQDPRCGEIGQVIDKLFEEEICPVS